MVTKQRIARAGLFPALALSLGLIASVSASEQDGAFIPKLVNSSTIPMNGDLNPYGVAFVPAGFPSGGALAAGDVLVSNFNDMNNLQGRGTTVVQLRPSGTLAPPGAATTFFTSSQPGLSTALGVLRSGYVILGNVPTTDGTFATLGQGSLQVVDRNGKWLATWADATFLDGPWDLALDDDGARVHVFVSNVGNGTVTRLDVAVGAKGLTVMKKTTLAHGYTHVPNQAALVLGPTGLAFEERSGALFVASTADNAIYRIDGASWTTQNVSRGTRVFADAHLRGPLALRFAPNGNLLAANGDAVNDEVTHPSEIVEFTPTGRFVREYNVDASQGGAFGLDTVSGDAPFNYAVIDDVTNSLSVYRLPDQRGW